MWIERLAAHLNDWWDSSQPIFFLAHNQTIVIQYSGHYVGFIVWGPHPRRAIVATLHIHPCADDIAVFVRRTLSALLNDTSVQIVRAQKS